MDNPDENKSNFGRNLKSAAIGIFTGLLFNVGVFVYQQDGVPEPYNEVARFAVEETVDGKYVYQATFNKLTDDCVIERLAVLGIEIGQSHTLAWEDNDGHGPADNRVKGPHVIDITIDAGDVQPEEVEIRTRHTCKVDGENVLVTKVFDRFTTFEVDREQ